MLTNELKAIEVLMTHLVNDTSLHKEVYSRFTEEKTFEKTKVGLFNQISINSLLDTYEENPNFSLEFFLYNGLIPGMYETAVATPTVDIALQKDVKEYYRRLYRALKDGNYTFDENNNIFVSSEEIETIVPQIWLYRLSNAYRKSAYKEMFLYNKKSENNILDINGLIDYLRHTKTFLVTMKSGNTNDDLAKIFSDTKERVISKFKDSKEVKVDDIIQTFKDTVPSNVTVEISKYKLADAFWLAKKVEKYPNFYSEPLEVQQKLINSWLIEFINSNEIANRQTQKYVLASTLREDATYRGEDIPKEEVIVGLFNLYIKLINELDLDLNDISLSNFHLTNYLSPNLQDNLAKLTEMIKLINKEHVLKVEAKDKVDNELAKLNEAKETKDTDKIEMRNKKYQKALSDYQEKEEIENNHQVARNQLQALITEEQKISLANIAFDNDKIMSLILRAIKEGRLYIQPNGNSLYIELYNDTSGKNIFKARISLEELLEFIMNVNLTLEDMAYTKKVS